PPAREQKRPNRWLLPAPEPIVPPAAPNETEDKHPALKKGKKS
ncbi:microcompartments protein, partial [Klebsiella aerogenes]